MAQKVTPMDVRMAAALAGGVGNVSEFCRAQGISRETFYKWRARIAELGVEGLEEQSRRPHRSPQAISPAMEQLLVVTRKELLRDGCDAGAEPILDVLRTSTRLPDWGLAGDEPWPSRATVHRLLVRQGLIEAAPKKRPKAAWRRFTYPRPNDCWQSDWTGWFLLNGKPVAIAGTLDDHSRLICALRAGPGDGTAELVWDTMVEAISRYGIPAMSLSDNGSVYSMARYGPDRKLVAFEANLLALGTKVVTSTPKHPQTCGKIERFWQTLKKWLKARSTPSTVTELQRLLDTFCEYYNTRRRHSAIGRRTPLTTWEASTKARPAARPLKAPATVLHATVGKGGYLRVGGDWSLGVGNRYAGRVLTTVRDGTLLALFDGNQHLCNMTIGDPNRRYHRAPTPRTA